MARFIPAYQNLLGTGELERRVEEARGHLEHCDLCPGTCQANRAKGEPGNCGVAADVLVASAGPHYGEEPVLVGVKGSGTIFLGGCNLKCVFCQNYDISWEKRATPVTARQLAQLMIEIQKQSCNNVNLVSPSHCVPQILESILLAAEQGLSLPIVYNSGGYDSLTALRLLDGVVDIYMPDVKYGSNEAGKNYSGIPDYWDRAREAVREMHRQVGDLQTDDRDIATRGLLVRHLVLPDGLSETESVLRFLADLSPDTFVNLMDQYHPAYRAMEFASLQRRITSEEFENARSTASLLGLHRGF